MSDIIPSFTNVLADSNGMAPEHSNHKPFGGSFRSFGTKSNPKPGHIVTYATMHAGMPQQRAPFFNAPDLTNVSYNDICVAHVSTQRSARTVCLETSIPQHGQICQFFRVAVLLVACPAAT